MIVSEQQMLDYVAGKKLPHDVWRFLADSSQTESHPVQLWLRDFSNAADDPFDVDWDYLALELQTEYRPTAAAPLQFRPATFSEVVSSCLTWPINRLIGVAAEITADYRYYLSAAQTLAICDSLDTEYGIKRIRRAIQLSAYLQMAEQWDEAEEALNVVLDPATEQLRPEVLVGVSTKDALIEQARVHDAKTHLLLDQRRIQEARTAASITQEQTSFAQLPAEEVCNHLNGVGMIEAAANHLALAQERLHETSMFAESNLPIDHVAAAVASRNLADVRKRLGIDATDLWRDSNAILERVYPNVDFNQSVGRLSIKTRDRRLVAVVC